MWRKYLMSLFYRKKDKKTKGHVVSIVVRRGLEPLKREQKKEVEVKTKTQLIKEAIYQLVIVQNYDFFTSKMIFSQLDGKIYLSDISKCLYKLHKRGVIEDSTLLTSRTINSDDHKIYCFWKLVKKDGTDLL